MAYIYKKRVGNKTYYSLRISVRLKDRIVKKDIAYLGNDPSKILEKLKSIPRKYQEEIRKSYRTIRTVVESEHFLKKIKGKKIKSDKYLDTAVLQQVEAAHLHYTTRFQKLHHATKRNCFKNFLVEFAYNTTSMEGNTINLEEAGKLLRENLSPKEKDPREIFDLQNTQKCFFWLLDETPALTHTTVINIHDRLLANIDERTGYRIHDIRVFKSRFDSSPGAYVKTDMDLLFAWFNDVKDILHPVALASIFHQKFEKIHPFADGNGRTGRMMMNYILIRKGYPPIIIEKKNRHSYLKALSKGDQADRNDISPTHYKELVEYAAIELIQTYWNNFCV